MATTRAIPWFCTAAVSPSARCAGVSRHGGAVTVLVGSQREVFACSLTDADMVRGCAPEQPGTVEVGQVWMNCESGESYPVASVRDDVIQRGDRLVRLGSSSYVILLSESDLRERYVCTDAPKNVVGIVARGGDRARG